MKLNYGLFLGANIVAGLILFALSFIPLVGIVAVAPITAGLYYMYLKAMRGEAVEFGMLFKGLEKAVPLLILGLIYGIPSILIQALQLFINLADILISTTRSRPEITFLQSAPPDLPLAGGMVVLIFVFVAVALVVSFIWSITFAFSIPIAMDHDVDALTAIKLSARAGWGNWGGIIVLAILVNLIFLVSIIGICLLLPLWLSPLYLASWAFAYLQVFPDLGPPAYRHEPPPPDAYQGSFGQGT